MALHKSDADLEHASSDTSVLVINYVTVKKKKKKVQANMKEQRETNNASPAVPVNLQMWPSAPREEEKGRRWRGRAGRSTKPAPDVGPMTLLHTQANWAQIRQASLSPKGPPSAPQAPTPRPTLLSPGQKQSLESSFLSLPLREAEISPLSPIYCSTRLTRQLSL